MMLLTRALVLLALSALTAYMLYRAEARLYPLEKTWETEVPAGRARAETAVRDMEAAAGHDLDARLAGPAPGDAFLLERRWSVSEIDEGTSRIRLVHLLRPVGFRAWLTWKVAAERRYANEARESVRAIKKVLLQG